MIIKLVRHGLSKGNTGELDSRVVGDHNIPLTRTGHRQARAAGKLIGPEFLDGALIYCSPYKRTRDTLTDLCQGAGRKKKTVRIYEDPRLRELDHGYEDIRQQNLTLRRIHGWFYYRFDGGESPADCFDRICTFLESMMRQAKRKKAKKVLIVSHGIMLRCFVMRFLHLTVEDFERMANPDNCAIITIAPVKSLKNPVFKSGKWGVEGLGFRDSGKKK